MILRALNGYYERLQGKGRAPSYGLSSEKISYAIVLADDGSILDVMPLQQTVNGRARPAKQYVPQAVKRASNVASNFLWDKTEYVFGCRRAEQTGQMEMVRRGEHAAFMSLHRELLDETDDEGLMALLAFLDHWDPASYSDLRHSDEMLGTNVMFRLDGQQSFLHESSAAQSVWRAHLAHRSAQQKEGMCLVTGEQSRIARLHPSIKGVRGAQSSGASIVSFNQNSFISLGKEQGDNAPVSEQAAFAYTTALNMLLVPGNRQCVQIGDATTVFWAESAGDGERAEESEMLTAQLLNPPSASDEEETARIANTLRQVAEGRPLQVVAPKVQLDTRIYVLGLAPNASRLSVRFWHASSVGDIFSKVAAHWRDLRLEPPAWQMPPSAWRLLIETAAQKKSENIPPLLGGALMRSILTGSNYPRPLLLSIITRLRADGDTNRLRIAIVKACIQRAERLQNPNQEDLLMSLDVLSTNVAYNLGRLFAAYAYAEKSYSNPNATIRDKYMGSASASPRRVFPVLMRGYEHNRASLRKQSGNKVGAGIRADKAVGEILNRLSGEASLPTVLSLEEQGRFFIGYYHQERAFYEKGTPDSTTRSSSEE